MRQVVLDTETTGLKPEAGHRLVEIGCVELVDRRPTGRHFHTYLNPGRAVEKGAFKVHGIGEDFLGDKPVFKAVAGALFEYLRGAELIIHNAPFDLGFLEQECRMAECPSVVRECTVFDTLPFSRKRHPNQANNLDALCRRYGIDNSGRTLHGALLDAQLLAELYLVMTSGQTTLLDALEHDAASAPAARTEAGVLGGGHGTVPLRVLRATADEQAAHTRFLERLRDQSGHCVWVEDGAP